MIRALGIVGFLLLAAHAGALLAIAAGLARGSRPWRGAVALALPPLGAVWAWEAGLKGRVKAYLATLAAFALVAVAMDLSR